MKEIIGQDILIAFPLSNNTIKWKTHENYKISCIGEIPDSWNVRRLKYLAPISSKKLFERPNNLPYIGLEHIESKTGNLILDVPVENVESTVSLFNEGCVLFGKLRPYLAKVVLTTFKGVCTTELLVFQPKDIINNKYLFYRLLSEDFISLVNSFTYGTKMPRASGEQIGNISIQLPSLVEQRAITTFLDRETSKLNALIAKKERLIELLKEHRSAIINQAVTKGLDSNVAMKDSKFEWLGKVPSHWSVRRMKYIVSETLKYGANEAASLIDPSLPRYIRITDINDDGSLKDESFRSLPKEVARPYLLEYGDILFARSGATVGKVFMYNQVWGDACYAGYLIRARINSSISDPLFVNYFVNTPAYQSWLSSVFIQATIQNVSAEKYANLPVPLPPLQEQKKIITLLDQETAKIDKLISTISGGIEKLKEYSSALISAAVTGKIDVRGEVEELSEEEEIDEDGA
jgi:restriction endonuclease S subunit